MFERLIAAVLSAALSTTLAATGPGVESLLRAADAPRAALEGRKVAIHATLETHGQRRDASDFELFVGRNDEALVVFRDRKGRERMYLVRGSDTFLIAPGARHAVKIPPEQRLFGGASFAELARLRLDRDYDARMLHEQVPCGEETCAEVEITARDKTAPYASGTLRLDAEGRMREAEFRLASGKPSKSVVIEYRRDPRGGSVPKRTVIKDRLRSQDALVTTLEYGMPEAVAADPARFDPERLLERK
jgi:hypothetical protein